MRPLALCRGPSGSFDQYVVLGAGLDTFAWRRPKPLATVSVFEVDHPASQQAERDRAAELGLPSCTRHAFVPCGFETESLAGCLDAADFDWTRPALFGWLGVTMYLTSEAIEATCRLVAQCAPGTEPAASYALAAGHVDADGERLAERFGPLAERNGEPIVSRISPTGAEALLTRCGLRVVDHPSREQLRARYFGGRADGLRPGAAERVLAART
jgi:methyltransferase (TIGR00027 family)